LVGKHPSIKLVWVALSPIGAILFADCQELHGHVTQRKLGPRLPRPPYCRLPTTSSYKAGQPSISIPLRRVYISTKFEISRIAIRHRTMTQLQTLIPELQVKIVKVIAEGPEDVDTYNVGTLGDWGYMRTSRDLKNLAFTCRALYRVTEPLLYTRFSSGSVSMHRPILCFIRTIMTRPELGRYVKRLSLRVLDEPWWGILHPNCWHEAFTDANHECEDMSAYKRVSVGSQPSFHDMDDMDFTNSVKVKDDMLALMKRTFEEVGLFRESFRFYCNSVVCAASSNDALLAGLFLLLPNIEEVRINCDQPRPHEDIYSFRLFFHTLQLLAAGYSEAHQNLRSLKKFTFVNSRATRPGLDQIQHLFQLPNLRYLELRVPICSLPSTASWTNSSSHPVTNRIETLVLICSGRSYCQTELDNLFLSMKRLKKLHCTILSPRPGRKYTDMGRSLQRFKHTLESLILRCSSSADGDHLGSLHDFTYLKSIEISLEIFFGSGNNTPNASLYELLPHSLQTLVLHIGVFVARSDLIDQLLALVLRKKTVCPELCDLVIYKSCHGIFNPILEELAKECKCMGIAFKFEWLE
jgi:hypothetical protein